MSAHVSTLKLNRYRYGELGDDELATVKAHLAGCERCSARLAAQDNNRAAFELEPVPPALRTAPRSAPSTAQRWLLWLAGPALIAASALLVIPASQDLDAGPPTFAQTVRTKGGTERLEVWVETDTGPRPVGNGEVVHPGDKVQLRVRRPPAPWVTLAGTDSTGEVQVYGTWQADPGDAGWQTAPFALGLDDTLGEQRFHAVFSEDRPRPSTVRQLLSTGEVPRPHHVETVTVENTP